MSLTGTDLRERLDRGPMSPLQWSAIAVCVLLNVLGGFTVRAFRLREDVPAPVAGKADVADGAA